MNSLNIKRPAEMSSTDVDGFVAVTFIAMRLQSNCISAPMRAGSIAMAW